MDCIEKRLRQRVKNAKSFCVEDVENRVTTQQKRSHKNVSESDSENTLTIDKTVPKKRRVEKSQSWTRWQETKKEPDTSKRKENIAAANSKPNRAGTRRTRSVSVVSDASVPNSDASERASVDIKTMHHKPSEPQLTRSESHLIVKWDSDDKNDDTPDIMEKSTVGKHRKLSLTKEDKVTTRSMSGKHFFHLIAIETLLWFSHVPVCLLCNASCLELVCV